MAPPRRREDVERENFLQAFEKPTQIYRYLRTRNLVSPIFLHRNLNYMSQRMSRTHKRRATFKIDSLLAEKLKAKRSDCSCYGNHMTIMFQGYFDRFQSNSTTATNNSTTITGTITAQSAIINSSNINNNNNHLPARPKAKILLEVLLLKIAAQRKRREPPATTIKQIGVVEIAQNPSDLMWEASDAKFPTISLNTDLLDPSDSPCTQVIMFRTQPVVTNNKEEPQQFTSELMMFDKKGRCLLTEGEYQLGLQEAVATAVTATPHPPAGTVNGQKSSGTVSPKKYASWENLSVFHSDSSGFEDQFEKSPIIKFQLHWTDSPYSGDFERIVDVKQEPTESVGKKGVKVEQEDDSKREKTKKSTAKDEPSSSSKKNVAKTLAYHEIFGVPSANLRYAFHFVHNNVSHQTTEQTNSLDCPWCHLNCLSLYSLLKHLKLCHARFAFNFVQGATVNSARIEVSINELFDGSYAGAPNNYLTTPSAGYAFSRSGPVRRTTSTHVQVCRPRRLRPSLAEFTETDEALEMNGTAGCGAGGIDRPYLTGHNRLYHHTMTCLPVHPRELDVDSEEESDPRWLKQKTMMMIDEFTDVNEGEKELMKMWNLHVMRHGFVGDCQTALACEMFVEHRGKEVLAKNLYRNFVVHMCSLFDYGLVSSEAFHKAVQKLQRSLNDSTDAKGVIYEARAQHRDHWNTEGYVKFEQQQQEEEQQRRVEKPEKPEKKEEKEKGGVGVGNGKKRSSISTRESKAESPEGPSSTATATTRSREMFQKPKGTVQTNSNGGGGAGKEAPATGSSSSNKKKTVLNGTTRQQSLQAAAAENPNKRKLERESSPTRRRSADLTALDSSSSTEKRARLEVTRRKSIAVIESSNKVGRATVALKRFSLSLTAVPGTGKVSSKDGAKK